VTQCPVIQHNSHLRAALPAYEAIAREIEAEFADRAVSVLQRAGLVSHRISPCVDDTEDVVRRYYAISPPLCLLGARLMETSRSSVGSRDLSRSGAYRCRSLEQSTRPAEQEPPFRTEAPTPVESSTFPCIPRGAVKDFPWKARGTNGHDQIGIASRHLGRSHS
jgi:hypothetical protein